MSRELLGTEDDNLGAPAAEADDVDLGTFQTGTLLNGRSQGVDLRPAGARDDPQHEPAPAQHEPDADDFVEDLSDEPGTAPATPGPTPTSGVVRRPPLAALLVGMALIALIAAAVAYEQTGRFIEGQAVDGAQVVGYFRAQEMNIDTGGGNGATVEGDFFLATSAAMPLTLRRLDLGYGLATVQAGVVLHNHEVTKVYLAVPAGCGPPTSAPGADVVSPDGRPYRLAVTGPGQQLSDYAAQSFCSTIDPQSGPGGDNSSVVVPDPAIQEAAGLAVGGMTTHGRAFSLEIRAGAGAPATRINLLPVDRPDDPRSGPSWQLDVQPDTAVTVQPGGRQSLVVVLHYNGCGKGGPRPTVHPVQVLAVPVDSPDSPRTMIAGWQEDVVARAAANALAVDCP